jgi:hypothetical protein
MHAPDSASRIFVAVHQRREKRLGVEGVLENMARICAHTTAIFDRQGIELLREASTR